MKQKIHDGISMTQGEIRKHEAIEWNTNSNLNQITKACLNYFQNNFSFEEYIDERSKKDSKFVDVLEEERRNGDGNDENS